MCPWKIDPKEESKVKKECYTQIKNSTTWYCCRHGSKKNTAAMQVLEDCAAGDDSNFENLQDVLDYMVEI